MQNNLENIRNTALKTFNSLGFNIRISDEGKDILIEPDTRKTGNLPPGSFEGMQIWYFGEDNIFEVSEQQAGPNANELHIYETTKSLKIALKGLLKGNNRKPSKVWN